MTRHNVTPRGDIQLRRRKLDIREIAMVKKPKPIHYVPVAWSMTYCGRLILPASRMTLTGRRELATCPRCKERAG